MNELHQRTLPLPESTLVPDGTNNVSPQPALVPNGTKNEFLQPVLPPKKKNVAAAIPQNPALEFILTMILVLELFTVLYEFLLVEQDTQAIFELGLGVLISGIGASVTKDMFKAVARAIGRKKAIEKQKNLRKFADQGWQLVVHTSFTIAELIILQGETWWSDTKTCWQDVNDIPKPFVKRLYVFQLGVRFWSSYSHRFREVHHKDYFVMFLHHVMTIALLGGSYITGFVRIGVLILLVHNSSDIIVDLLKMVNHAGLEAKQNCFATEILFVTNLITWFISRLWIFPVYLVYSAIMENEESCRIALWQCNAMRFMLIILVLMHFWWFFLFIRMGIRLLLKDAAHKVGREEYEGSSDEEGDPKSLSPRNNLPDRNFNGDKEQ